tara:strand:+ start:1839 stop:2636 length:798 start_codon:yes stop_codon:yes gene_type:complete
MNQKIWIDLFKVVALFGGIWAAATLIPWGMDDVEIDYPIDKENELGDLMVENIIFQDQTHPVLGDKYLDSVVEVISDRLLDSLGQTDYYYEFYVVQNDEVNAFALPGGNIVIYTGLLRFAENADEVAAVLAHEIGHMEEKHVVKRLVKEFGVQILFSVVGGDGMVLSEITKSATSTYFDRGQEEEADEFGLHLLDSTNIDPRTMGVFFKRLDREYGYNENLDIFMTHPNLKSRVRESFQYPIDSGRVFTSINLNWDEVHTALEVY